MLRPMMPKPTKPRLAIENPWRGGGEGISQMKRALSIQRLPNYPCSGKTGTDSCPPKLGVWHAFAPTALLTTHNNYIDKPRQTVGRANGTNREIFNHARALSHRAGWRMTPKGALRRFAPAGAGKCGPRRSRLRTFRGRRRLDNESFHANRHRPRRGTTGRRPTAANSFAGARSNMRAASGRPRPFGPAGEFSITLAR